MKCSNILIMLHQIAHLFSIFCNQPEDMQSAHRHATWCIRMYNVLRISVKFSFIDCRLGVKIKNSYYFENGCHKAHQEEYIKGISIYSCMLAREQVKR
jgi:hypothetical protein